MGQKRQLEQINPVSSALQKKPEDTNRRSADMWSFAVLLWELVTREVPFADLSNMEIGMKVRAQLYTLVFGDGGSSDNNCSRGGFFPHVFKHTVVLSSGLEGSVYEIHVLRTTLFFPVFIGGTGRPSAYHPTRHFPPCV